MMAKNKKTTRTSATELDSVYVLKLVMYLIVGTFWIRIGTAHNPTQLPIPVGLVVGVALAMHEHFRIDRKIEYAVLLVAMLVGFWTQAGLVFIF